MNDTVGITATQIKKDVQMRSTGKFSIRKAPHGAALGTNLFKFPPGFFSGNMKDIQLGRNKINGENSTVNDKNFPEQP